MAHKRDEQKLKLWGVDYETWRQIGQPTFLIFSQQRQNARNRGIGWDIRFVDWWRIWKESGKWPERGKGAYVMARKQDIGPYSPDNVYICHQSVNSFDGWREGGHTRRVDGKSSHGYPLNVSRLNTALHKTKPYMVRVCGVFVGTYPDIESAVAGRDAYRANPHPPIDKTRVKAQH